MQSECTVFKLKKKSNSKCLLSQTNPEQYNEKRNRKKEKKLGLLNVKPNHRCELQSIQNPPIGSAKGLGGTKPNTFHRPVEDAIYTF
jgi:hypothetical protein